MVSVDELLNKTHEVEKHIRDTFNASDERVVLFRVQFYEYSRLLSEFKERQSIDKYIKLPGRVFYNRSTKDEILIFLNLILKSKSLTEDLVKKLNKEITETKALLEKAYGKSSPAEEPLDDTYFLIVNNKTRAKVEPSHTKTLSFDHTVQVALIENNNIPDFTRYTKRTASEMMNLRDSDIRSRSHTAKLTSEEVIYWIGYTARKSVPFEKLPNATMTDAENYLQNSYDEEYTENLLDKSKVVTEKVANISFINNNGKYLASIFNTESEDPLELKYTASEITYMANLYRKKISDKENITKKDNKESNPPKDKPASVSEINTSEKLKLTP